MNMQDQINEIKKVLEFYDQSKCQVNKAHSILTELCLAIENGEIGIHQIEEKSITSTFFRLKLTQAIKLLEES